MSTHRVCANSGYSHRVVWIFAQGGYAIGTRGEGVIFQIGNIKASRHLSFNDVNISTFPNKACM
jgi:hypothetical protein